MTNLTPKTIKIVKSTVPVLEENGELLTRHFYKRMFSHNPEVLPFFNSANQKTGHQQQALAGAICAYAANIEKLDVLGNAVELIAQKHASLRIKPEHYPIVGANLLASIKEVLGDGATEEVISAWGEAYGFLADILINREKQIYKEQESIEGGWKEFKKFKVVRKEKESEVITSFYLEPRDGRKPPTFKPGQYITVRVPSPCGHSTMRNYSLSNKPDQDYFRISVKCEKGENKNTPDGFVSNLLHDKIEIGMELEIAPPCGEFFLDVSENHKKPLVLMAAGVGITPIMSMLLSALNSMPNRKIIFIHANINEETQAFRSVIDSLEMTHSNLETHYCYSQEPSSKTIRAKNTTTGFVDGKLIESFLPDRNADYYFCGPKPFMVNIYHELLTWGIPASQVHFEFFGPKQELDKIKEKISK